MATADLNLLVALDALLAEGSVTGAARRLGLSPSAMSRALARLRTATGDPLLAPSGRALAPTPRAAALRDQVHALVHDARSVLRKVDDALDPETLAATFTIRASQSFLESLCAPLAATLTAAAPLIRLRFVAKLDRDLRSLREGVAELEIGVVGERAPEVRTRLLFRDSFVGVVRTGHPLLTHGPVAADRFAACGHVAALLGRGSPEPVDISLDEAGLSRNVVVAVPGYPDALRIARETDLVAVVPRSCLAPPGSPDAGAKGLASFALPARTPEIKVFAMWHPRLDADPAQNWLRRAVFTFFKTGA